MLGFEPMPSRKEGALSIELPSLLIVYKFKILTISIISLVVPLAARLNVRSELDHFEVISIKCCELILNMVHVYLTRRPSLD